VFRAKHRDAIQVRHPAINANRYATQLFQPISGRRVRVAIAWRAAGRRDGQQRRASTSRARAAGTLAGSSHARACGATIRSHLIAVAARASRHGRGEITLHLPEGWHREQEWMNLFEAGKVGLLITYHPDRRLAARQHAQAGK
jgi:hypothetical protein